MKRRDFITYSTLLTASSTPLANKDRDVLTTEPVGPAWSVAEPMPIQTQELYPSVHQSKLYVAGGIASKQGNLYFTDRFFSYTPETGQWVDEAKLPKPLHHAALVSTGRRLFLVGGFYGAESHFWRMQDEVYEWVDGVWQPSLSLPTPQAEGILAAHDTDIHLVSGQSPKGKANVKRDDHKEVTRHLIWQAGSTQWERAAPIPLARNSATGGWIADQLIVTGGRNAQGNFSNTHIYDKKEDRWREASPMPLPQAGTASVIDQDHLIVFGGEIFVPKAGVFGNVWRYTLSRDEWQAFPSLPTPRHGLGAGKIDGRVYVIGGATQPSGVGTSGINEVLTL